MVTAKRTRIAESWEPSAKGVAYAQERGLGVGPTREEFYDHHAARGNLMADWEAAWRTWCRNQVKFAARSSPRSPPMLSVVGVDSSDAYGAAAWARGLSDARLDTMPNGDRVLCVGGYDATGTARDACRGAGLDPSAFRGSLDVIAEWLRDGITPEWICESIQMARKPSELRSLRYFDGHVRRPLYAKTGN